MKTKVILVLLVGMSTVQVSANTLKEVVGHVLDTNPIVNERLRNYNATRAEIDIAEAGYYPTVDVESAVGRKTVGLISSDVVNQSFNVLQNSLVLRQNIFSGFSTDEKVNYQKMRALSASYSYLEKANEVALQAVNVYTNVQKEKELLENSRQNVERNEKTYKKIKKSYDVGLSTLSDVSKMHSSLSLAKSNMMIQKNRLLNAQSNFERVVGSTTNSEKLKKVDLDVKLPKNRKKAQRYALEYNPAVLAGKYNIQGAKALHRESKSGFYPKVDLELSQRYNDNYNEFTGTDDRAQGLVVVSYNLYNGGADEAKQLNTLSKVNQEVSVVNDLKRQVTERVNLSWDSYKLALDQITFLKQYKSQSQKTLTLYYSEFELGNRSLLDLIFAENDVKRANDELIAAKYNLLLSKYRIMNAMGLIVVSIMGSEKAYYKRVGMKSESKPRKKTISYDTLDHGMKIDKKGKETPSKIKKNKRIYEDKVVPVHSPKNEDEVPSKLDTIVNEFKKVRWQSR